MGTPPQVPQRDLPSNIKQILAQLRADMANIVTTDDWDDFKLAIGNLDGDIAIHFSGEQ